MQRVFTVNYSSDSRFIISGSDDTNIRIWKTNASEALGLKVGRQDRKELYSKTIKRRYAHMPEIQRMTRDKKPPKSIKKAKQIQHDVTQSERRKQDNR